MENKIKNWNEFLNENDSKNNNHYIDLWNNYLSLVDIIDGVISEYGELPSSYWQDNCQQDLDNITSEQNVTVQYISDNETKIKTNFKELMDGLNGWMGAGNGISKYGSLSDIDISLFNS
jgi:hypothetical protein